MPAIIGAVIATEHTDVDHLFGLAAVLVFVAALVLAVYPETAGQELEALNPEDA